MKNKQNYTPVRFSHLTSYASIGAIVRSVEDKLMVIRDTRYWTDKFNNVSAEIIPYVTRVRLSLGLDKDLRVPPIAQLNDKGVIQGSYLSAVLFPTYASCQQCGLLHNKPWKNQNIDFKDKVKCEKCEGNLEQVTWCAVSSKGYLDDVPWHYVCHLQSKSQCRADYQSSYLKLYTNNGKRFIKCTRCGSSGMYENIPINVMNRQQPWIYNEKAELDDGDTVEILEVNNPSVYLPERVNAIVIPPESRHSKSSIVDQLYTNSKLCREIEKIKNPLRKKGKIKETAFNYRCSVNDIKQALADIKAGYPLLENDITEGQLLEDEYKALREPLDNVADDEDFVTVHKTEEWKRLDIEAESKTLSSIIKGIDQHIIVSRLREIQVFKGFQRIPKEDNNDNLVPPDIVGKSDWLPAIELFGEGIFFTLDEEILQQWEQVEGIKRRTEEITNRYANAEIITQQDMSISPRFLLLHTLAHLLIRELEITAGYPAASLSERIYCSQDRNMAGVLIYTAVADIVGSLGGIVESGEPKAFLELMSNVFKHAQWCSVDPVCTEHEGQGPGWLNRAACHACALIPEPSCEYSNVFLDRVFIKGNEALGIPSFLDFVMEINNGKQKV